jgi:hypothetical protein
MALSFFIIFANAHEAVRLTKESAVFYSGQISGLICP